MGGVGEGREVQVYTRTLLTPDRRVCWVITLYDIPSSSRLSKRFPAGEAFSRTWARGDLVR